MSNNSLLILKDFYPDVEEVKQPMFGGGNGDFEMINDHPDFN